MSTTLELTGERMLPLATDDTTFWAHVERYRFACGRARGLDVLDVACGEGYGSAALVKAGAQSVIGIDIDPETVTHARVRYKIEARVGSAENLPIENNSIDLLVSFETIEHVPRPEKFIEEAARVLRPGGMIIVSTPNLQISRKGPKNPFHCSEMDVEQFQKLLNTQFTSISLFGQRTPWVTRLRGFRRLAKIARKYLDPIRAQSLTASVRNQVVDLCLRAVPKMASLVSSDTVQSMNCEKLANAVFIIAVAKKREVGGAVANAVKMGPTA